MAAGAMNGIAKENGKGSEGGGCADGSEFQAPNNPLRRGPPDVSHRFTPAQMEALAAVCDTLLPSLLPPDSAQDIDPSSIAAGASLGSGSLDHAFYRLSASDAGVPAELAGQMIGLLKPARLLIVTWALWLLSTRLGTFLLCGRASLSWRKLMRHTCGVLILAESSSSFEDQKCHMAYLLEALRQLVYVEVLNIDCVEVVANMADFCILVGYPRYLFWSLKPRKVDGKGSNPVWSGIGYCGPDPNLTTCTSSKVNLNGESATLHDASHRPLGNKVIDAKVAGLSALKTFLKDAGYSILLDTSYLRGLSKGLQETSKKERKRSPGKGINTHPEKDCKGKDIGVQCDVVIVGSGAGGGVMAAVLAKAGYSVIVLEKGRYFARDDFAVLEGPALREMYENSGGLATEDGGVNLMVGTTVGGGTTINWSASFKTPPHVRHEWAEEHELSLFVSEEYNQAMETVCERLGSRVQQWKRVLQIRCFGKGVSSWDIQWGMFLAMQGQTIIVDGVAFGCPKAQKKSTAETWLVDAVETNRVVVVTSSRATEVLHIQHPGAQNCKPRKAQGVVALVGDGPDRLFIKARATVVASGTINTPPLLKKSGLKNPNIGRNLHLHPVQMIWGYFQEGSGPAGTSYTGDVMTSYSEIAAKWDSSCYGTLLFVPCLHPGSFAAQMPWLSGADFKARMQRYSRTAHLITLTRDKGGGKVEAAKNGDAKLFLLRIPA